MLTLVAHDKLAGQRTFHRQTHVSGVNLQKQGYTPMTLVLEVSWTAEAQSRPAAQKLITVGGKPGMVLGTSGKGRVACIGMTCFGTLAQPQTPFWQWRSSVLLPCDLAWWVAGQDEHFS